MTHRDQITEARRKILELEREKQRIDNELKAWKQIRDAHETLAKTVGAAQLVPTQIGPTEAILVVLGKYPDGLTPTEIREQLSDYGVAFGSEKNFLGNIHKIVKRHKDIEQIGSGGRKLYRLKAKTQG